MIKKFFVKNYKSLKELELELQRFNVLIGPNAGGKSNIIDVLAFISELTSKSSLLELLGQRGGFEKVVFKGEEKEVEISLAFSFKENLSCSYSITFSQFIEREKLIIGDKIGVERGKGGEIKALSAEEKEKIFPAIPPYISALRSLKRDYIKEISSLIQQVHQFLSSFRFYQFIPSEIRKALPVVGILELERSGGNLAQVLHTIHSEKEEIFEKIEELLKQGIPEVEKLRTPLTPGKAETYIAIREKSGLEADYHQLSDGTLKLLAFITAVSLPEATLICFEEPENFIHARLQKLLVEILKKSEKQILISTHNPYFVDFVEPEDVIIVEKEKGQTKAYRIKNPQELKRKLEELELGLGEYYYSGALGGIP